MRFGSGIRLRHIVPAASLLLLCLAVGFSPIRATYGQAPQRVAGTTVSLVAPDGFVPATSFSGLMNPKTNASVLIAELPLAGYAQIAPVFADLDTARKMFAQHGVTIEARTEIDTADGGKVPLLTGTQRAGGVTLHKSIALFKGARTVMITVQAPEDAGLDEPTIKAMLASVSFGSEPTLAEKVDALPFTVRAAPPFRIVDSLGGSGLYMIVGEPDTDPTGMRPMVIVAHQRMPRADPGTLEATAERLLKGTRGFESADIGARERLSFAGAAGVLITGTHTATGGTKRFAQYMAYGDGGRYVRMVASVDEASTDSLKPSIEAIARSVAFKSGR